MIAKWNNFYRRKYIVDKKNLVNFVNVGLVDDPGWWTWLMTLVEDIADVTLIDEVYEVNTNWWCK